MKALVFLGVTAWAAPCASAAAGTPANVAGLGILASGARRVLVIDPLGRNMMRDASTGEGAYEIPDAVIEDVSSEHDNGDDDAPLTGYDIDIPTTVDGHSTVVVYSDDGLAISASGYTSRGIFSSDDAVDTTAGPMGNIYDVLYSGSGRSVSMTRIATFDVTIVPPDSGISLLRMRDGPARGLVEFVLTKAQAAGDAIDVFDTTGRRMGAAQIPKGTGARMVTWEWRRVGVRPGVYLARLRSRGSEVARFIVLH